MQLLSTGGAAGRLSPARLSGEQLHALDASHDPWSAESYQEFSDAYDRGDLRARQLGSVSMDEALWRWYESQSRLARLAKAADQLPPPGVRRSHLENLRNALAPFIVALRASQTARSRERDAREQRRVLAVQTLLAAPHGPTPTGAMPAAA